MKSNTSYPTIAIITLFNMRCCRFSFNSLFFLFSIFLVDGVPVKLGLTGILFHRICFIIQLKASTRGPERTFWNIFLEKAIRTKQEDWRTISISTLAILAWLPGCRLVMLAVSSVLPPSPCLLDIRDSGKVLRSLRS